MTAVKAPPTYTSGWCGSGSHDRCRGAYAGADCCCACHQEPPEPEPAPIVLQHCPTCTCDAVRAP